MVMGQLVMGQGGQAVMGQRGQAVPTCFKCTDLESRDSQEVLVAGIACDGQHSERDGSRGQALKVRQQVTLTVGQQPAQPSTTRSNN